MSFQDVQKKVRLSPGASALIINAPKEYLELVSKIRFDTQPGKTKQCQYDFVQVFGSKRSELEQLVDKYSGSGKYDCLFWICYPKGGGMIKSDINRNVVWAIAEHAGMRCVTQVAIDETWSALRCRPIKMVGNQE
jgi:hypothetical protein